ncbi:hypothetical protein GW17_00016839 [Ensete ventricosum]|nr:hypothetical protein GW17_00016839 [Ensete ventricosum]
MQSRTEARTWLDPGVEAVSRVLEADLLLGVSTAIMVSAGDQGSKPNPPPPEVWVLSDVKKGNDGVTSLRPENTRKRHLALFFSSSRASVI